MTESVNGMYSKLQGLGIPAFQQGTGRILEIGRVCPVKFDPTSFVILSIGSLDVQCAQQISNGMGGEGYWQNVKTLVSQLGSHGARGTELRPIDRQKGISQQLVCGLLLYDLEGNA